MDLGNLGLPNNQFDVASRFLTVCLADARIVAAFLGGSHARGQADEFSDLDLYFVTTDEAYAEFLAGKALFARQLGKLLFLEDFGQPHGYLFIHENGTEGEFWFGRQSDFKDICSGPYKVLFDRYGILPGGVFPAPVANQANQMQLLRRQIDLFWHELSHFTKAMGRKQWWFAYGQIEAMRRMCVILARLNYDFGDANVDEGEPYFKIEDALPADALLPLRATCCAIEEHALLEAGDALCEFFMALAPALAKAHGLSYSVELERLLRAELRRLGQ